MELKNIKKVLIDLSILLAYDLEPCKEIINIKHIHINGISYPIFKECLLDYLDKNEKKLTTMFIAEQSSAPIEEVVAKDAKTLITDEQKIKDTVALTDDIGLIMLHRSLFILKNKVDLYEKEIKEVFSKYNEGIEDSFYIIDFDKIKDCLIEVGKVAKFDFDRIDNFNDVVKSEIKVENEDLFNNQELMTKFINFARVERRKYNHIFKEKKTKPNFNLDNYKYYVPTGIDELKKDFIETIKEEKNEITEENVNIENKEVNIDHTSLLNNPTSTRNDITSPKNEITSPKNEQSSPLNDQTSISGSLSPIRNSEERKESLPNIEETKENGETNEDNKLDDSNGSLPSDTNQYGSFPKETNPNEIINTSKIRTRKGLEDDMEDFEDTEKEINQIPSRMLKFNTRSYTKYYIFIETLPLIIADFLSEEGNVVVLDHGDEIRDNLRTLFDNEILTRMGEEGALAVNVFKTEKLRDYLLALAKIDKNIKTYEDMVEKKKITNENTALISKALDNLKIMKIAYENRIKTIQNDTNTYNEFEDKIRTRNDEIIGEISNVVSDVVQLGNEDVSREKSQNESNVNDINDVTELYTSKRKNFSISVTQSGNQSLMTSVSGYSKVKNKKKLTKEEKREIAKKEIFYFYSHQHTMVGYKSTFDSIKNKLENLNLGEFCKFCVEFKILLKKEKIVEIFKKSSKNTKDMNYQEFCVALEKIAIECNNEKINGLKRRIFRLENIKKNILIQNEMNAMKQEQADEDIIKWKNEIKELKQKDFNELIEELYEYIEIDNEENYRRKMKGFILPFNDGKMKKLPKIKVFNRPQKLDIKTAREIKMILDQRKYNLEKEKKKIIRINAIDKEFQKKKIEKANEEIKSPKVTSQKKGKIYLKANPERNNYNDIFSKQKNEIDIDNNNQFNSLNASSSQSKSRFMMIKDNSKMNEDNKNGVKPNSELNEKDNRYTWDKLEKLTPEQLVNDNSEILKLIN